MKRSHQFEIQSFEQQWLCPITSMPMIQPVVTIDGHCYEKNGIQQWLKKQNKSPKTNLKLKSLSLIPNITLKNVIFKYRNQLKHEWQKLKKQNTQYIQNNVVLQNQLETSYAKLQINESTITKQKETNIKFESQNLILKSQVIQLKRKSQQLQQILTKHKNQYHNLFINYESTKKDLSNLQEQYKKQVQKFKLESQKLKIQHQKLKLENQNLIQNKQKQSESSFSKIMKNLPSFFNNNKSTKQQNIKIKPNINKSFQSTNNQQLLTNLNKQKINITDKSTSQSIKTLNLLSLSKQNNTIDLSIQDVQIKRRQEVSVHLSKQKPLIDLSKQNISINLRQQRQQKTVHSTINLIQQYKRQNTQHKGQNKQQKGQNKQQKGQNKQLVYRQSHKQKNPFSNLFSSLRQRKVQMIQQSQFLHILPFEDYFLHTPAIYDQSNLLLNHVGIRIDMNQFVKYDWSQLKTIFLFNTQIDDQALQLFFKSARHFKSLENLYLWNNAITNVKRGTLQLFPKLKDIAFYYNSTISTTKLTKPLNEQTKQYLKDFSNMYPHIQVKFSIQQ